MLSQCKAAATGFGYDLKQLHGAMRPSIDTKVPVRIPERRKIENEPETFKGWSLSVRFLASLLPTERAPADRSQHHAWTRGSGTGSNT